MLLNIKIVVEKKINNDVEINILVKRNFEKFIFSSKKYLSNLSTLYEKYNAAFCTNSEEDSITLINCLKKGIEVAIPEGKEDMFKEIIYAGKEKYDVLEKYYEEISANTLNYLN